VEGKHEGIVTKEEFQKAQEIFTTRGDVKKGRKLEYLLRGKAVCGTCGRRLAYREYVFRQNQYYFFVCKYAAGEVGDNRCCSRMIKEDTLNAVVWSAVRKLLDMTDSVGQKLEESQKQSRQNDFLMAQRLAKLQREKEKCESDKFVNVDQFMAGDLQKDIYLARRAELAETAERIEAEIQEAEKELHEMETAADDGTADALGKMKRYAGENQLNQKMVQELIEKVVVTDPEHVEIVWKFSDEVRKFIGV
jgi:hypothetical protein